LLLFAFACSLYFVKLGIGEFESWDESHIVYRAVIIEQGGSWLDQSPQALGGLYSTSHPPLGVWLMVGSRALFGPTEFATRLPSAICGVLACVGMLYLLRRWADDRVALLLATAFACSSLLIWYSRHAQLDSLLLASSIWALVFLLKLNEPSGSSRVLPACLLLSIALSSKLGWALYIMPFVVVVWLRADGVARRRLAITVLSSLVLGSAWYVYMAATNEGFLSWIVNWLTGLSSDPEFEGGGGGKLYYLNQLMVGCPFVLLAILRLRDVKLWWPAALWLASVMGVLQVSATKMPHFALLLLPPAFVLSACAYALKPSLSRSEIVAIVLSVLWSLSQQLRLLVRGVDFTYIFPSLSVVVFVGASLAIAMLIAQKKGERDRPILVCAGLILLAASIKVLGYTPGTFNGGARRIANAVSSDSTIHTLAIVHSDAPHDSLTPQLSLYLEIVGGNSSIAIKRVPISKASEMLRVVNPDAVAIHREFDRFSKPTAEWNAQYSELTRLLSSSYQSRDSLRSYDLFRDRI
jgi:4-amino-4-deoxy-L-arabinose transferase-like glycosyltransferase